MRSVTANSVHYLDKNMHKDYNESKDDLKILSIKAQDVSFQRGTIRRLRAALHAGKYAV